MRCREMLRVTPNKTLFRGTNDPFYITIEIESVPPGGQSFVISGDGLPNDYPTIYSNMARVQVWENVALADYVKNADVAISVQRGGTGEKNVFFIQWRDPTETNIVFRNQEGEDLYGVLTMVYKSGERVYYRAEHYAPGTPMVSLGADPSEYGKLFIEFLGVDSEDRLYYWIGTGLSVLAQAGMGTTATFTLSPVTQPVRIRVDFHIPTLADQYFGLHTLESYYINSFATFIWDSAQRIRDYPIHAGKYIANSLGWKAEVTTAEATTTTLKVHFAIDAPLLYRMVHSPLAPLAHSWLHHKILSSIETIEITGYPELTPESSRSYTTATKNERESLYNLAKNYARLNLAPFERPILYWMVKSYYDTGDFAKAILNMEGGGGGGETPTEPSDELERLKRENQSLRRQRVYTGIAGLLLGYLIGRGS